MSIFVHNKAPLQFDVVMRDVWEKPVEKVQKRKRDDDESFEVESKKARLTEKAVEAVIKPSLKRVSEELSSLSLKKPRVIAKANKRVREDDEEVAPEPKKLRMISRKRVAVALTNENAKRPRVDDKAIVFVALRDGSSKANRLAKPMVATPISRVSRQPMLNSHSSMYEVVRKEKKRPLDISKAAKEPETKKCRIEPSDPMVKAELDDMTTLLARLALAQTQS